MTSPDTVAPRPEHVNSNEERDQEERPTQRADDKVDSRLDTATASESVQAPGSSLGLTFDSAPTAPAPAPAPEAASCNSVESSSSSQPTSAKARTPKQAHFTLDPPETRTISPAPAPAPRRRPSYNRAPSSSSSSSWSPRQVPPSPAPVPKPTLVQTYKDLHALLKGFLLLVPPFIRRLRFLIPTPLRSAARFVIRYSAMFLHARGILGSNWVYDVVASMWRVVIDIFFREIRSRGAWKIPRQNEGAVIFVVGPHHNQVSPADQRRPRFLTFVSPCRC